MPTTQKSQQKQTKATQKVGRSAKKPVTKAIEGGSTKKAVTKAVGGGGVNCEPNIWVVNEDILVTYLDTLNNKSMTYEVIRVLLSLSESRDNLYCWLLKYKTSKQKINKLISRINEYNEKLNKLSILYINVLCEGKLEPIPSNSDKRLTNYNDTYKEQVINILGQEDYEYGLKQIFYYDIPCQYMRQINDLRNKINKVLIEINKYHEYIKYMPVSMANLSQRAKRAIPIFPR